MFRGNWAERLLAAWSRAPGREDYFEGQPHHTVESALDGLRRRYPAIEELIKGSTILDLGCGTGHHAAGLAQHGAKFVVGVDIQEELLADARTLSAELGVSDRTLFCESIPEEWVGRFDIVMSFNSMEHFPEPEAVLQEMAAAARPGGQVLISFSPPWYAPYGSHMHFFTRLPWVNLLFSESTVMRVRARFRDDGAVRYEDVEGGLNRMSLAKFERLTRASGLRPVSIRYVGVKRVDLLTKVPLLRELVTNEVIAHFECQTGGQG